MKISSKILRRVVEWGSFPCVLICFLLTVVGNSADAQTPDNFRISVGDDYGAVIDEAGNLFLWGAIVSGENAGGLQQVPGAWREVSVSRTPAAEAHLLLIASNGTLWAFGNNERGQVGKIGQTSYEVPVEISPLTNWVEVAAGASHSLARNDVGGGLGYVFAWGDNTYGQLNKFPITTDPEKDIQRTVPNTPVTWPNYWLFSSISAGNVHSHAIRNDGTLWAWGSGYSEGSNSSALGVLIDGERPIAAVPLRQVVTPGVDDGWTKLFGGFRANYALRDLGTETGQLWVWGGGNLGNNLEQAQYDTPVRLGQGSGWSSVSLSTSTGDGQQHALALKSNGSLYGWGSNWPYGQLGLSIIEDNVATNTVFFEPIPLEQESSFLAVGAGDGFSVGINAEGFLLSAGDNSAGQLANGSVDSTGEDGQEFFDFTNLGQADLVAKSVTINEQAENITAGNTVSVAFQVENGGTGPIEDDFGLRAILNTSETFSGLPLDFKLDTDDSPIFTVTDDFAAGQTRNIEVEVILPTNIPIGEYYLVLLADSEDVIVENSEDNNSAATERPFSFLPDLIVPMSPSNGLAASLSSGADPLDPLDDKIQVELQIENAGSGSLPIGTAFNVRVFLTPDRTTDNSAAVDLSDTEMVILDEVLEADGGQLPAALSFSFNVPRMPLGDYYVGVELDVSGNINEQPELLNDNNIVVQVDGEANNTAFSDKQITIDGLTVQQGVDQTGSGGEDGPLTLFTEGEGDWFGQTFFFNEDAFTGNDDAAQSPSLKAGESASFRTETFTDPVAIAFDWSADTSDEQNFLRFRVFGGTTGGINNKISSTNGWVENVSRVVPADAYAQWEYVQGVEGIGDVAYVDYLDIVPINAPDLVIDDIYFPSDVPESFVLQRDNLDITLNSRNQGQPIGATEQYAISIYLSSDPVFDRPDGVGNDDILIYQDIVDRSFGSGDSAVNLPSIPLDITIEPGSYYIVGYIDDYQDGAGNPLGDQPDPDPSVKNDPIGQIDEFKGEVGGSLFPGEDNNLFITDTALVNIVALPDLVGTSVDVDLDYYVIEDRSSYDPDDPFSQAVPNSLLFGFVVSNLGLGTISEPFEIQALFSKDQAFNADADYSFVEYIYEGGFGSVLSNANVRTISPDKADFRQSLVEQGYIGERLFFGVLADSSDGENGLIQELNERNNSVFLFNNDLILSERKMSEALDLTNAQGVPETNQSFSIINDEVAPYDSSNIPWVGQTSTAFDAEDAAASVIIGDGETSQFSVLLEPDVAVRVSFWWKASSEDNPEQGQRDFLGFYVDPGSSSINFDNADRVIYGTGDQDSNETKWRRVEVVLEPGSHTLTWAYVKDGQGSDGADRGWVDQLTITELPNLTVTGVSVDDSIVYQSGGEIANWSVTVQNDSGVPIEPGARFDVNIRLLTEAAWNNTNSVPLTTISDSAGLAAGASRTYDFASDAGLLLPDQEYVEEFYYLGAYVDWSESDLANGQISESDDSISDNSALTPEAIVQLGLPDLVGSTSAITGLEPSYGIGATDILDVALKNEGDGPLPAGSVVEVVLYASPANNVDLRTDSSALEIGRNSITLVSNVLAGDPLPTPIPVDIGIPYGLAVGDYYIGAVVDPGNVVKEQKGLPSNENPVDRANGEANNSFFTASTSLTINGISLPEAVDLPGLSDNFSNSGAAAWFGRDEYGDNAITGDEVSFSATGPDGDGAQSPAIQTGESASFTLQVAESSSILFDWGTESGSNQNVLSVLVNGAPREQISGSQALVENGIVVPSNSTITWVYTKDASASGDYALVDNIRILPNDLPDLAITNVDYKAGQYILDRGVFNNILLEGGEPQYLNTKYLDVSASAQNIGDDLEASLSGTFTTADIEVRLSSDDEYGNSDDIILGSFAQVEGDFSSGNVLSFLGPIALADTTPAGFYHLIVRIDPNDRVNVEFSELNNLWISDNPDVQISRRPDLVVQNVDGREELTLFDEVLNFADIIDVDETGFFSTSAPMRIRFNIQNIGLGKVEGSESFITQVNLRGIRRPDESGNPLGIAALSDIPGAATAPIVLGEFTIQDELLGRSFDPVDGAFPGETRAVELEVVLPQSTYFLDVIEADTSPADYLWFIEVIVNRDYPFEESSSYNTWWGLDVAKILDPEPPATPSVNWLTAANGDVDDGLFGINRSFVSDVSDWESSYGLPSGSVAADEELLLAYAFNRNPFNGDTTGNRFPGSFGFDEVGGDEYLSITFDFPYRVNDLRYIIEGSDTVGGSYTEITRIDTFPNPDNLSGGFNGDADGDGSPETTGPYSLGEGGLIEDDRIVSIIDFGDFARVTIIDENPIPEIGSGNRFMRVNVQSADTTSVPDP